MDINVHDQWAVESMGPIQDRTREHLGYSDRIITAARRMFFRAIDDVAEGRDPQLTRGADKISGPTTIDAVGPSSASTNTGKRPGGGAAAGHTLAGPGKGNDMSDFVSRHGLWTGNRRRPLPTSPSDRETRHSAFRVFRPARRGPWQDAYRGRCHRRAAKRRHVYLTMVLKDLSGRTAFPVFQQGGNGAGDMVMVADPTTFRVCRGRCKVVGSCATSTKRTARRIPSPRER